MKKRKRMRKKKTELENNIKEKKNPENKKLKLFINQTE
ncbi:hypothetical protein CP10743SC13_2205, partial [Chlamydia psittaci 10_743_SC13]